MKKTLLVIPVVIVIALVLFFVISFINYNTVMDSSYISGSVHYSKGAVEWGLFNSNETNSLDVYLELWPGESIYPKKLESVYRYEHFDEEIQIFNYEDLLNQNIKINVDFLGAVESYGNQNYVSNELENESIFLKGKISCNARYDFIKEIEIKQKNCEVEFSKINEEIYEENKDNLDVYVIDPVAIEIRKKYDSLDQLSVEYEKLGFFDYLFNNAQFEEKRTNLINADVQVISEIFELVDQPKVDAQKELDEILNFMSDKNMDLIIQSRHFVLEDEFTLSTNYSIKLSKYLDESVGLSNNIIENLRETNLTLAYEIKKENGSFEIQIKRA